MKYHAQYTYHVKTNEGHHNHVELFVGDDPKYDRLNRRIYYKIPHTPKHDNTMLKFKGEPFVLHISRNRT